MRCSHDVSRRLFVVRLAKVATALSASGACGDGVLGGPFRGPDPAGGPLTILVADFPGLATDGIIVAVGRERAAMRTGPTSFLGLSMICTHQGCTTNIVQNGFRCPCHNSQFASDGSVIKGPDVPSPPIAPLVRLQTSYNAATDMLTID